MRRWRRSSALPWVALGLALAAPACGRTGIDDLETIGARPGAPGGGGEPRLGDAASNAADVHAPPSGESESDGSAFFTTDDSTGDASENPNDGLGDDGGGGGGGGGGECGPANCPGCCTAGGACLPGLANEACGNHGETCGHCDVERLCNAHGACG